MANETLEGVVEIDGEECAADVRFEVGDDKRTRKVRHEFVLRTKDGRRVMVDAANADIGAWEEETMRDQWSDLEAHRFGALFADDAPGPHVSVRLTIRRVAKGARAAVSGEVHRTAKAIEGGDYRKGARGEDELRMVASEIAPAGVLRAERVPAEKEERRWSIERLIWGLALLVSAVPAVWFFAVIDRLPGSAEVRLPAAATSFAWVALAFAIARELLAMPNDRQPSHHGSLLPSFARGGGAAGVNGIGPIVWVIPVIIMFSAGFAAWEHATHLVTEGLGSRNSKGSRAANIEVAAYMELLPAMALLLVQWVVARRPARLARALLGASGHPRKWVTFVGTVSPEGRDPVAIYRRTMTGRKVKGTKGLPDGHEQSNIDTTPFVVEGPHGRVQVNLHNAEWATTFTRHDSSRRTEGNILVTVAKQERTIPAGARIAVAGRIDEDMRMAGKGPESLIVFATSPRRNPRLTLLWRVVLHHLGLVMAAACLLWMLILIVKA
jgi:hypothetical protein